MSGKGSNRRKEDRAAVEANWDAIQWGVRDGVQGVHEAQGSDESRVAEATSSDEARGH